MAILRIWEIERKFKKSICWIDITFKRNLLKYKFKLSLKYRFGIDDPYLDQDENKSKFLTRVVKNGDEDKDNKTKNIYYKDKKFYGYMFVYDANDESTLEEVRKYE